MGSAPDWVVYFAIGSWFCIFGSIIIEAFYGMLTKSYSLGAYFTIEYVQMLMFLPVVGAYFSSEVLHYFRLMRHALLSYDFCGFDTLVATSYSDSQRSSLMRLLGFEFNSGIINITPYLGMFLQIGVIHLYIFLMALYFRKNERSPA